MNECVWTHEGRLPHVLAPSAYTSLAQHTRERERLFDAGWHVVATRADLPAPGAAVPRVLFGTPILLRNDDGELRAFVNLPRQQRSPLRTATLGALVFVSLVQGGPSLEEHLGEATAMRALGIFPVSLRKVLDVAIDHPCNWKIPIENVLESYHVPFLHDNLLARHPELFRVFGGRRDGGMHAHELGERYTAYHDSLGADSRAYRALLDVLKPAARVDYVHHHAFPNLVMGHTSIVSYLQSVEPISPATSRSAIRLFLDVGGRGARAVEHVLAPLLDRVSNRLIRRVMAEDAAVYADVQRGMAASRQSGVLGSREERVHRFQEWIAEQTS